MKTRTVAVFLLAMLFATAAGALEWNSKFGVGARGPFLVPLFKGSDYVKFRGSYEPFMMGWDGTFDLKYGIPKKFIISLSIAYTSTHDDTTATADQSFKMNKSDNAYIKLTGILLGLTGQFYFLPEGSVQPYLLAGIGVDIWSAKTLAAGTGYGTAPLGSKYKFSDLGA